MYYGLECNIIDITNKLLFIYKRLASEFQIFITPPANTNKAIDFI